MTNEETIKQLEKLTSAFLPKQSSMDILEFAKKSKDDDLINLIIEKFLDELGNIDIDLLLAMQKLDILSKLTQELTILSIFKKCREGDEIYEKLEEAIRLVDFHLEEHRKKLDRLLETKRNSQT